MGVKDARQKEIYTEKLIVSEPNACEVETAIENLKETNHQVLSKSKQN
jgi:hypothetical protein